MQALFLEGLPVWTGLHEAMQELREQQLAPALKCKAGVDCAFEFCLVSPIGRCCSCPNLRAFRIRMPSASLSCWHALH